MTYCESRPAIGFNRFLQVFSTVRILAIATTILTSIFSCRLLKSVNGHDSTTKEVTNISMTSSGNFKKLTAIFPAGIFIGKKFGGQSICYVIVEHTPHGSDSSSEFNDNNLIVIKLQSSLPQSATSNAGTVAPPIPFPSGTPNVSLYIDEKSRQTSVTAYSESVDDGFNKVSFKLQYKNLANPILYEIEATTAVTGEAFTWIDVSWKSTSRLNMASCYDLKKKS